MQQASIIDGQRAQLRDADGDGLLEKIVSYIKHVLQPGETIRYEGSVHWILYLPAIILALVAAAIFVLSSLVAWGMAGSWPPRAS